MKNKQLNNDFIPITNDFMFCTVMEDRERCREFLQRVLGIQIAEIECSTQKSFKKRHDSRGVRLDVYAIDIKGNSYDIEMQTVHKGNLPKRTRYYHSEMDGYQIKSGADYETLGKNIVIFVCTFDPFGYGESVYRIESVCREHPEFNYGDGVLSIYLNTTGNTDNIEFNLRNVLEYIKTGSAKDTFTSGIDAKVKMLNHDEDWRDRNMTFEMKLKEMYNDGLKEGLKEGFDKGREESLYSCIKNCLKKGLSETDIINILDCTADDINTAASAEGNK